MKRYLFILLLIFPIVLISCNNNEEPKKQSILRGCTWEGHDNENYYNISFLPGTFSDISPITNKEDIKKPEHEGVFDEQGIVYIYYRMDEYSNTVQRKGVYFLYKNNLIINCYKNSEIVLDRNYMIEVFSKDKIVLREMGGYHSENNILELRPIRNK